MANNKIFDKISIKIKSLLLFICFSLVIIFVFSLEYSIADASYSTIIDYWIRNYITLTVIMMLMIGYAAWEYRAHRQSEIATMRLENIASSDTLTAAYNRRYFTNRATEEMAEACRYGQKIGLLMLDIDHFKHINDQFGHAAGDQTLKELVIRIQTQLRQTDLLGRWGGDEFLVMLPHCSLMDSHSLAEKLRKSIAENAFPDTGGLRISIGASEYRPNETFIEWLNRTDQALYQAKLAGGNSVKAAI